MLSSSLSSPPKSSSSSSSTSTSTSLLPERTTTSKPNSKSLNLLQIAQLCQEQIDVKDRKYRFKTFPKCFIASDAVTFLVNQGLAQTRKDAVLLGRRLEKEVGLWHHVCNDHSFKDEHLFFRFYSDDDDDDIDINKKKKDVFFGKTTNSSTIIRQGEESLLRIADALELGLDIGNRIHHFKMYHNCFTASEAIDYMIQHDLVSTRQEAVKIGQRLEMEMEFWYCAEETAVPKQGRSQPAQASRNTTTTTTTTNRGSVFCGGISGVKNNNNNNNDNGGAQFRDECIIFRLKHAQVDDDSDEEEKDVHDDDSGAGGGMARPTSLSASLIAAAAAGNYQSLLSSLKSSLISPTNVSNNNSNSKSIVHTPTTTTTTTTTTTHRDVAVGGSLKNKSPKMTRKPYEAKNTNNNTNIIDDPCSSSEEIQQEINSTEFNQLSNREKAKMVLKEFGLGLTSSTDFHVEDDEDDDYPDD